MPRAILRHEKLAGWVDELGERITVVGPVDQEKVETPAIEGSPGE